jgi:hypothetical protein
MEGYCSTGQSPQWAVVPVEEEEEEEEEEVPPDHEQLTCSKYVEVNLLIN